MAISDKEDAALKTWVSGKLSEEELAAIMVWLRGKLGKNYKEELIARRALARAVLVGEPLPKGVRWLLSERFDPDEGDIGFLLKSSRARGRPKVKARDWEIAAIVERHIQAGDKKEAAFQFAAEKIGVSKRTAEKAHAECKDQIRALGPQARIVTSFD